ncbi:MAG: hypothetical protein HY537_15490 [Deltaproteobacteria bacterium]|nr:hypothetical protein [Deltaproteobacteria bacterium]
MLTGSFAMHFYANPRMTRDIDIVVELTRKDVKRFCEALGSEFYSDEEMATQAIQHGSMFNIIFKKAGIKVDFVIKKQTEYAKKAFSRKKEMELLDAKVWVCSAEDLVVSKLDWAKESKSEMQLRDVSNLLKVRELDLRYVEKWIEKLELKKLYARAKTY